MPNILSAETFMIRECSVTVLPHQAADELELRRYLQLELGLAPGELMAVRVLRRSIDARRREVKINLQLRLYLNEKPDDDLFPTTLYHELPASAPTALIVGAGPAGLFAALRLIEHGIRPLVVERGKDVHRRRLDIARISKEHLVDPDSNYGFGEGGAGAYSDGKLFTRSKKRGDSTHILHVFCQHGADTAILRDAHPHLGTDKLPGIIERMRQTIVRCGGEVRFECRMEELLLCGGGGKPLRVAGLRTASGEELAGPVILATGHSARDVYRHLFYHPAATFGLEAKGIAVGVRLEHPQHLVDCIQYHNPQGRGAWLPPAEYRFVAQCGGRGVYSFCMCPGGVVVPAATGPEQVVVNGMSASSRSGRWANSGMVVELRPEDAEEVLAGLPRRGQVDGKEEGRGALRMMALQERLEYCCWEEGGRRQTAPAQCMYDFVRSRAGQDLPRTSYSPGVACSELHRWMPGFIRRRLQEGLVEFGKRGKGFLTNDAVLIGVETRTSAPVRIPRDAATLQHEEVDGLFPCGEGAGYAGGIVSAGVDGERCADALAGWMGYPIRK